MGRWLPAVGLFLFSIAFVQVVAAADLAAYSSSWSHRTLVVAILMLAGVIYGGVAFRFTSAAYAGTASLLLLLAMLVWAEENAGRGSADWPMAGVVGFFIVSLKQARIVRCGRLTRSKRRELKWNLQVHD